MTLPPPAKRGQREYFGDEKLVFISDNSICHSNHKIDDHFYNACDNDYNHCDYDNDCDNNQ